MPPHFHASLRLLAAHGLNLVAILDAAELPLAVVDPLIAAGVEPLAFSRLLLVGHGGRMLWRAFQAAGGLDGLPDPLDRYTRRAVASVLQNGWGVAEEGFRFLYPLEAVLVPLQQLGTLAGWAHRSPIGSDIHPDYGLWFAYRAAVLVAADLPLLNAPLRPSPCDTCAAKPCLSACPAGAVGAIGHFGLNACLTHRLRPGSSCAARCLSRLACPVAPQHRYTDEQVAYHYDLSLGDIRRYMG